MATYTCIDREDFEMETLSNAETIVRTFVRTQRSVEDDFLNDNCETAVYGLVQYIVRRDRFIWAYVQSAVILVLNF